MSRPSRVLIWMSAFLAAVLALALLLSHRLSDIFAANPFFNGVILAVLAAGIVVNVRQVLVLAREVKWIESFRRTHPDRAVAGKPRLLAPMAQMLAGREHGRATLSAPSMRTILDSVQLRLEESRDLSRYLIGLAIFLGLLGTFWGLLVTIRSVADIIGGLDAGNDATAMFGALKHNLKEPLGGMATSFSTSLFGLASSLVIGFLDLQSGHAQNRFYNELEEWLSAMTHLASGSALDGETAVPAYVQALLEQTADGLERMQRAITDTEHDRRSANEQLAGLSSQLGRLNELLSRDARERQASIEVQDELRTVLRQLASTHDRRGDRRATSRRSPSDMSALARRHRRAFDIWPGFVDALSALIMVMVFVLLIFAVGQFVLSDTLAGKNRALDALHARIAALARTLSLSEDARKTLDARVQELSATLAQAAQERDQARSEAAALSSDLADLMARRQRLDAELAQLATERDASRRELIEKSELNAAAAAQIELLNRQIAAIRQQLDRLSAALDQAKQESQQKDLKIADLGRQLNVALAERVGQLERYRSEFFGKLREALGNRSDVQVVGDRFVLPTDILFDSGSAALGPGGEASLDQLVITLRGLEKSIPSKLDWVLRIDGHTDRVPIRNDRFPSNWELSTARALTIVKYLEAHGVPAKRLSANGFGEFRPLDPSDTPAARAKNRRIELKLTDR